MRVLCLELFVWSTMLYISAVFSAINTCLRGPCREDILLCCKKLKEMLMSIKRFLIHRNTDVRGAYSKIIISLTLTILHNIKRFSMLKFFKYAFGVLAIPPPAPFKNNATYL